MPLYVDRAAVPPYPIQLLRSRAGPIRKKVYPIYVGEMQCLGKRSRYIAILGALMLRSTSSRMIRRPLGDLYGFLKMIETLFLAQMDFSPNLLKATCV